MIFLRLQLLNPVDCLKNWTLVGRPGQCSEPLGFCSLAEGANCPEEGLDLFEKDSIRNAINDKPYY